VNPPGKKKTVGLYEQESAPAGEKSAPVRGKKTVGLYKKENAPTGGKQRLVHPPGKKVHPSGEKKHSRTV